MDNVVFHFHFFSSAQSFFIVIMCNTSFEQFFWGHFALSKVNLTHHNCHRFTNTSDRCMIDGLVK